MMNIKDNQVNYTEVPTQYQVTVFTQVLNSDHGSSHNDRYKMIPQYVSHPRLPRGDLVW